MVMSRKLRLLVVVLSLVLLMLDKVLCVFSVRVLLCLEVDDVNVVIL